MSILKIDIPIDSFFEGYEMYDKIKIAADIGYDGVEIVGGFRELEPSKIRKACEDSNVKLVNFTMNEPRKLTLNKPYDVIEKEYEFAVKFLNEAGCGNLLVIGGEKESKYDEPKAVIVENLKRLSEKAEKYRVSLNIEPINNILEHREQYLAYVSQAYEIVKCINSPWVNITYDIIHTQAEEGNIIDNMLKILPTIKHLHISALPFHNEVFYFEVQCQNFLKVLETSGYKNFVGLEYFASYDSYQSAADSLMFIKDYANKGLMAYEPFNRKEEGNVLF